MYKYSILNSVCLLACAALLSPDSGGGFASNEPTPPDAKSKLDEKTDPSFGKLAEKPTTTPPQPQYSPPGTSLSSAPKTEVGTPKANAPQVSTTPGGDPRTSALGHGTTPSTPRGDLHHNPGLQDATPTGLTKTEADGVGDGTQKDVLGAPGDGGDQRTLAGDQSSVHEFDPEDATGLCKICGGGTNEPAHVAAR